jgi:hypothetical protein
MAIKLVPIPVHDPLTEDEWYSVSVFKERTEEVIRQLLRLRLGQMVFQFSRRPNDTYEVTGDIPSDDDLRLLYFEFRHLYAKKEPGNFMRVANIIARRARNPGVVECIKHLKNQSRSDMVESGFFHDKQGTLSGTKLVNAWFNGKVFHSDRERRRELAELNGWLSIQGVRVLLFFAIYDAVLAAKNLYHLIKDFRADHMEVLLPEKFCNTDSSRTP